MFDVSRSGSKAVFKNPSKGSIKNFYSGENLLSIFTTQLIHGWLLPKVQGNKNLPAGSGNQIIPSGSKEMFFCWQIYMLGYHIFIG